MCSIFSSSERQRAVTWLSIFSLLLPENSTIFKPRIGSFSSSVRSSFTECQIISCLARFKTLESTVSTESALAFTIKGALRNAASKERYLILMSVRYCGIGRRLSLASQINAREPSEPVRILVRLNSLSSSLNTFLRSYPVKKRLSCGRSLMIAALFSLQCCAMV